MRGFKRAKDPEALSREGRLADIRGYNENPGGESEDVSMFGDVAWLLEEVERLETCIERLVKRVDLADKLAAALANHGKALSFKAQQALSAYQQSATVANV